MTGLRGSALAYRFHLAVIRHRRPVAAGLLAAAVAAGLQAVRPPPPAGIPLLVAARDLPAGHRLTDGDLATGSWCPQAVPAGVVPRPAGRVLSSAIRRGEPLTDTRLLGDGLLTGLPADTVAVAVRLADPASALVVRSGERADVLAGPTDDPLTAPPAAGSAGVQGGASVVVSGALVVSVPAAGTGGSAAIGGAGGDSAGGSGLLGSLAAGPAGSEASGGGAVLVLAVTRSDAVRLADVAGRRPLSVALHERMST